jgi:hypothetical protein
MQVDWLCVVVMFQMNETKVLGPFQASLAIRPEE